MAQIRLATVGGDPEGEATLATALERCVDIDLYIRCVERTELLAAIRSKSVDVVLLVGVPHWVDPSLREELTRSAVPAIGYPRDPLEAVALEELGASLVDDVADVDGIVEACRHARPPGAPDRTGDSSNNGRLIGIWGTKGAPGRTTVATELAFVLAGDEPSTILIDGDPWGGDVVQALGVEPGPSVIWAAQAIIQDHGVVQVERGLSRVGRQGPVLLPGLARPSLWQDISGSGWKRLLTWAKTSFSQVVVDMGPSFDIDLEHERRPSREGINASTLGSSDLVVCVVRADPIGIRNFLCEYPQLEERVDPQRIRIVLNRVNGDEVGSLGRSIKQQTGLYPVAQIPHEPQVAAALWRGRAVTENYPDSALVASVRDLAASLGAQVRARSVLARLVGR